MADFVLGIFSFFDTLSDLKDALWDIIKSFVGFIFDFIKIVSSYFSSIIDFLRVYVIELPITLINMFGVLPTFVQAGLIVLLYSIYIAFVFKLLKLIVPFL